MKIRFFCMLLIIGHQAIAGDTGEWQPSPEEIADALGEDPELAEDVAMLKKMGINICEGNNSEHEEDEWQPSPEAMLEALEENPKLAKEMKEHSDLLPPELRETVQKFKNAPKAMRCPFCGF